MKRKIAMVTGANRGIGFEIVKQLGRSGITVVMTARDEEKGRAACEQLKQEDLDIHFFALDVTNEVRIQEVASYVQQQFGILDILINNAGIYIDNNDSILDIALDTMRTTVETNVYGPLRLAQVLVPLLKQSESGRIINVSSGMGALSDIGAFYPSYALSKAALNMITMQLGDALRKDDIYVNAMCPGWVRTDMGGRSAPRSVIEGADTAVWLATADIKQSGKFFRDRKEISW
ncbi:SDR family oxidoreductase [Ectobacillus sp. JY-23]|uniref:SDR family oxidoreductase n=1 Tax=Ectobacillus sp. JY-23 TaxID=2933872 RepID=UPI001FF5866C|nr:SDR family oxidoreductase [Ectobacillus sp. JY-23]UOY91038.1 SDR family oxidoreductase [Ectobacillus sp. JY-23]